jgi:hypothetical protein
LELGRACEMSSFLCAVQSADMRFAVIVAFRQTSGHQLKLGWSIGNTVHTIVAFTTE